MRQDVVGVRLVGGFSVRDFRSVAILEERGFVKTDPVVEDHESGEVFRVEVPKFARIREIIFSRGENTPIFGFAIAPPPLPSSVPAI